MNKDLETQLRNEICALKEQIVHLELNPPAPIWMRMRQYDAAQEATITTTNPKSKKSWLSNLEHWPDGLVMVV